MKKPFEFAAQAGRAINKIYGAIQGLNELKKEYKEKLGIELDISADLKGIKENLEALVRLAERYVK